MSVATSTATLIGASIAGGALLGGTKLQTRASGKAAKTQVASANEAARIGKLSADEQLAFAREQAALANANADADRLGNYGQWKAGMQNDRGESIAGLRNSYNQFGDKSFNDRASEVSRGRTDVGMFNAGAYNTREASNTVNRNEFGRYKDRQTRVGVLGEMLGMAPRQIAAYQEPAALREAQYFAPDPLQRTGLELPPDLILPDYVPRKNNA